MPLLSLITLPAPADFIASSTAWATPIFSDLVYILAALVGLTLGGFLLRKLGGRFSGAVKSIFRGGRRGGRRRR